MRENDVTLGIPETSYRERLEYNEDRKRFVTKCHVKKKRCGSEYLKHGIV